MKFWVKVVVAVCVILVVAFAVWAFFFREKEEVQAYNKSAEMLDYKESLGINEKLITLQKLDYYGEKKENVLANTTETEKEILTLRNVCLSNDPIVGYGDVDVVYTYSSYLVLDEFVNEIIEYYLPYTIGNSARNKSLNNIKNNINDYIDSMKKLNNKLDDLIKYQNSLKGTEMDMEGLKGRYNNLYVEHRSSLNKASKLILSMLEYVDESVYSDKLYVDTMMALTDAFARSLNRSTSVDKNQEPDYANDVYVIKLMIRQSQAGQSLESTNYSEYDFLYHYNKLFNNYKDTLNYIFSCKHFEKQKMADGDNLSKVLENAKPSVVTILNVMGF